MRPRAGNTGCNRPHRGIGTGDALYGRVRPGRTLLRGRVGLRKVVGVRPGGAVGSRASDALAAECHCVIPSAAPVCS